MYFRHAEAVAASGGGTDYDRPLHERGKSEASLMGQRLVRWPNPDFIISSPALRAVMTVNLLVESIEYPVKDIVFEKQIYEAELEDLYEVLQKIDDSHSCVMLVGHNPSLTHLVNALGTVKLEICQHAVWGYFDCLSMLGEMLIVSEGNSRRSTILEGR